MFDQKCTERCLPVIQVQQIIHRGAGFQVTDHSIAEQAETNGIVLIAMVCRTVQVFPVAKHRGSDEKEKTSTLTFGPFVRYYAVPYPLCGGRLIPFAEGKVSFGSSKESYTYGSSTESFKWGATQWSVGPGMAMFVTDNICVDMMVVYRQAIWTDKDGTETTKYIDGGFGLSFGLSFFIPPCW